MAKNEITFHNKTEIKAQAQVFTGHTLVSSCIAGPGETCTLPVESLRYDIYLKNGTTGWELTRKLDSQAKTFTLMKERQGWFVLTES